MILKLIPSRDCAYCIESELVVSVHPASVMAEPSVSRRRNTIDTLGMQISLAVLECCVGVSLEGLSENCIMLAWLDSQPVLCDANGLG